MNEEDDKTELQKWGSEILPMTRKVVIGGIMGSMFAGGVAMSTGAWNNIVALWNLPAAVEANSRAIQRLRIPRKVFEISDASGPVLGACISGQPCRVKVRTRRLADALECKIVPGSLRYYYYNPRTNQSHAVETISGTPRNVGTEFINLEFVFSTPFNLEPRAELCVQPEYTNCPGQELDDDPVTQAPECFEVVVRDAISVQ